MWLAGDPNLQMRCSSWAGLVVVQALLASGAPVACSPHAWVCKPSEPTSRAQHSRAPTDRMKVQLPTWVATRESVARRRICCMEGQAESAFHEGGVGGHSCACGLRCRVFCGCGSLRGCDAQAGCCHAGGHREVAESSDPSGWIRVCTRGMFPPPPTLPHTHSRPMRSKASTTADARRSSRLSGRGPGTPRFGVAPASAIPRALSGSGGAEA